MNLKTLRKGNEVKGVYMGVAYTGVVVGAREQFGTNHIEVEISFGRNIDGFRGGPRNGIIITGLSEGDELSVVS